MHEKIYFGSKTLSPVATKWYHSRKIHMCRCCTRAKVELDFIKHSFSTHVWNLLKQRLGAFVLQLTIRLYKRISDRLHHLHKKICLYTCVCVIWTRKTSIQFGRSFFTPFVMPSNVVTRVSENFFFVGCVNVSTCATVFIAWDTIERAPIDNNH